MTSPETERQGQFLRWLFVLLALAVPALVVCAILHQCRTPTMAFGVSKRDYSLVLEVIPGGSAEKAGLRVGDAILTADGVPYVSWHGSQWGQTHSLEVERDGRRLTLAVPAVSVAQVTRWHLFSAAIVALILWGTGTLLFWRRFRQGEVRILFLLLQVFALAIFPALAYQPYLSFAPRWMASLATTCFHLAAPFFLHYQISFPVLLGSPGQRRRLLGLVYGLALLAVAGGLTRASPWMALASLYTVLEGVAGLGVAAYVYARRAGPDDRRRLRLVFAGTILGLAPPIFGSALPSLLTGRSSGMPEWLIGPFLLIPLLCLLVAVARHNLFGIDRLLNRALVYGLLSLGIFGLYLVPFLLLYRLMSVDPLLQTAIVAGLTLVVGFGFNWARVWVQRLVDRLFYGGWYDYPGVVEVISDALSRTLERTQLAEVLTRRVPKMMQLREGWLWVGEAGAPLPEGGEPAQLRLPLTFEGQVRGLWTIGERRDGEDLSAGDRRILRTLARQAEIALSNVLLVERLRRQLEQIRETQHQLLRSREQERARLARDLHDGPIQSLVGLNLQLGLLLAPQEENPAMEEAFKAMRAEVRELLADLRRVCADLRPPMLDTFGLGAALRALVEDCSAQHGLTVHLELPPDATLRPLPEEVAVNLYRVVQEALSNASQHAAARNIAIELGWEADCLTLRVQDDGQGFVVPAALHDLAARDHFGLVGMQERINLIDGQWTVDSAPGRGTTVRVRWRRKGQATSSATET